MAGALDGQKSLGIGQRIAGPFCKIVLSDLGADVIAVERPGRGGDRRHSPLLAGCEAAVVRAALPHSAI